MCFYPSYAVGLHPLRKPCLQRLEGFVQRHIVLVAFPDGAALIQCPDKRRTLSIIPDFNPAVGLYPACNIWIHVLKTACSLWHCLLPLSLRYLYDRHTVRSAAPEYSAFLPRSCPHAPPQFHTAC